MGNTEKQNKLIKQLSSNFQFGLFKIFKLPMAFLAGIKITAITTENITTSLKYKYLNTNPFKSVYFAVLNMGAELASGALVMLEIAKYQEDVSMLVISAKSEYYKKATGRVYFDCKASEELTFAIKNSVENNEPSSCILNVSCKDENGVEIGKYLFEWSFKKKK